MTNKVKRPLQQLIYQEKRIAIEHAISQKYENLSDEAKEAMREAMRWQIEKSSFPVHITFAQEMVEKLVKENAEKDKKIALYEATKGMYASTELDECNKLIEHYKQQILNQANKHKAETTKLNAEIEHLKFFDFTGIVEEKIHTGFLVENWKQGWKWLSTWAFALIGYIQVYGVPPELMQFLPGATQSKITALLAVMGFAFRFVNQTKPTAPLPEVKGDA